ncbi:MAG: response regulator [Rubrivivax sp.]|nr:MAG: response regulator [Rubrivivax sp.]
MADRLEDTEAALCIAGHEGPLLSGWKPPVANGVPGARAHGLPLNRSRSGATMSVTPRRTVLYVEDHPVNALLMAAIFEHRPQLDLVIATTGEEAMRVAAGLQPALLLLDLGLPDCHGSQLLGSLRTLPGLATPPAVAVTADASFEIEGTGFRELWLKPLYLEHVLNRLDVLTGSLPVMQLRAIEPQSFFSALA